MTMPRLIVGLVLCTLPRKALRIFSSSFSLRFMLACHAHVNNCIAVPRVITCAHLVLAIHVFQLIVFDG